VFNRNLDRRLDTLGLPAAVREQVRMQRPQLAAIKTDDARVRNAVRESFVDGYRGVVWIAAFLATMSSLSAATMIDSRPR